MLELTLPESAALGHHYIGTEHILLGLVRENEGVAARILLDFDADAEKIRNEIIRMLSGERPTETRGKAAVYTYDSRSRDFSFLLSSRRSAFRSPSLRLADLGLRFRLARNVCAQALFRS